MDCKKNLHSGKISSKQWWDLVKDSQGEAQDSTIPPLTQEDGSTASAAKEKVGLLAQHFSSKMTAPDPSRPAPSLPVVAGERLTSLTTAKVEVHTALSTLEEKKAVGADEVSPKILLCSAVLASPLSRLSEAILHQKR